jgi:hypothetical protein
MVCHYQAGKLNLLRGAVWGEWRAVFRIRICLMFTVKRAKKPEAFLADEKTQEHGGKA